MGEWGKIVDWQSHSWLTGCAVRRRSTVRRGGRGRANTGAPLEAARGAGLFALGEIKSFVAPGARLAGRLGGNCLGLSVGACCRAK